MAEHDDAANELEPAQEGRSPASGAGTAPGPMNEQDFNAVIEDICNSKADELRMLGYESVTGKDVWDCISAKYKELPPLHRMVNDILSLRATGLMNWMTLSAWKDAEKQPRP
jgi:hypothetical protein